MRGIYAHLILFKKCSKTHFKKTFLRKINLKNEWLNNKNALKNQLKKVKY